MFTRYEPRLCTFLGERNVREGSRESGYRLKTYSIVQNGIPFEIDRFERSMDLIRAALPQPVVTPGRCGVGFLIFHQGATGDYAVVCWWDNENELPTRVFVRDHHHWRHTTGGESFCVWDLNVMWHERQAYVQTVLAGEGVDRYMSTTLNRLV